MDTVVRFEFVGLALIEEVEKEKRVMDFWSYLFSQNKKEETAVSEKAVCDEVAEKTVKDALVEELEETERTQDGEENVEQEEIVSK